MNWTQIPSGATTHKNGLRVPCWRCGLYLCLEVEPGEWQATRIGHPEFSVPGLTLETAQQECLAHYLGYRLAGGTYRVPEQTAPYLAELAQVELVNRTTNRTT